LTLPPDSLWLPLGLVAGRDDSREGNWLIRTQLVITDSLDNSIPWGLYTTHFTTAYDVYWDGVILARNGTIGSGEVNERPGKLRCNIFVPPHLLTVGNHTILFRISHHHSYSSWRWFYGDCAIGPLEGNMRSALPPYYRACAIIGILSIPFLLNLFLFFGRKQRAGHLLISILCACVILDSTASVIPAFLTVSTLYVHWELYTYHAMTFLFALLLPAFLVNRFALPKRLIGINIAINSAVYVFFTTLLNAFDVMALTVLIIGSVIALWALWQRKEGSRIIGVGLLAGWVAYYFGVAFDGLGAIMVVCTSVSLAQQFIRNERGEREAQLKSAHLENELLRKQINPHFLLNTLTSIIVWLRKDPASAIRLVEALAEEFGMILKISGLKQITVQQEIDLCKAHLTIMNLRKGATYALESVDIVGDETVPPMIFHTLIENGLTHGYEGKTQGTFVLTRILMPDGVRYMLRNDGDFGGDASRESTGFGLRYIRGRLEESYPGRWSFISQPGEQGWESVIDIREK
jgi:hypothetical protein